jgi:hypothetical protein
MDKDFWVSVAKNDYMVPEGHSLEELTNTLFGFLGSTDPELRDEIAYIVYANLLKRDLYTNEEIQNHIRELLANLENGIGETESDSVFLRTFSVLFLAEIVHNDNKKELFGKDQILAILEKGLWYLASEKDPRGFVPVKGWAHALAHTADLMLVLGRNRHVEADGLERILQGIARKLVSSTDWVYIHGEDERLANTVMAVIQRDLLTIGFWEEWLKSLTEPEQSWKGAYMDEGQAKAFHNVRNFLRSLWIAVHSSDDLSHKAMIELAAFEALNNLKPY